MMEDIPKRVFLDTASLNFILEYGEEIFDGKLFSEELNDRIREDIDAFHNIFLTGQRATWELSVSPFTYTEIIKTNDAEKKHYLDNWFMNVWDYWHNTIKVNNNLPSFMEAEEAKIKLLSSGILDILSDIEDRVLLSDAIVYRCDYFCTRDWHTILRHRDSLETLPLKIIAPSEWWNLIKPFAALWA